MEPDGPPRHAPAGDAPTRPAEPPCDDGPRDRLAWLACDGESIRLAGPIVFHPDRRRPPPGELAVLRAVAAVLERHPEVLLLRIEVWATAAGSSSAALREATEAAQGRADAVLRHLFRVEGVDAERLEALGRAGVEGGATERFRSALRVVQRARQPR